MIDWSEFKFQLGDLVQQRATSLSLCILSRAVVDSPAGFKRIYLVRGGVGMDRLECWLLEIELEKPTGWWLKQEFATEIELEKSKRTR